MRKMIFLGLAATAFASACSPMPDAIAPVSAPAGAYDSLSCAQTQQMLADTQATLAKMSDAQTGAAVMDTVGVFFLLVPLGQVTGQNHAGDIASMKGKVEALNLRLLSCQG